MRLKSLVIPILVLPPSLIVYAWLVDQNQSVSISTNFKKRRTKGELLIVNFRRSIFPIVAVLFVIGAVTIWLFSGTLSYVVDANVGNASIAIATNSLLRGVFAAIASQGSDPLLSLIGNGFFYSGLLFSLPCDATRLDSGWI